MPKQGNLYHSYLARREWMRERLSVFDKKELIGVEIGVWKGYHIQHLLAVESRIKTIYAVDVDLGKVRQEIKRYGGRVVCVEGLSAEVSHLVPGGLDFIHVDANHHYEFVWSDLSLYEPKLLPGGLCSGHDYYKRAAAQVKLAVNRYAKRYGRNLQSIEGEVNSWWWYMPGEVR